MPSQVGIIHSSSLVLGARTLWHCALTFLDLTWVVSGSVFKEICVPWVLALVDLRKSVTAPEI